MTASQRRETETRIELVQVDLDDPRAKNLRTWMDTDTTERYNPGRTHREDPTFVAKRARALAIAPRQVRATLLALDEDGEAVGHAVLRRLGGDWEVKRLVVLPQARGRGVARALLAELERLAAAEGAQRIILQTGNRQPEAIGLYETSGYSRIPVYEPYIETMPDSICFEKALPDRAD